jgi:hypothetical protein
VDQVSKGIFSPSNNVSIPENQKLEQEHPIKAKK